GGPCPAATPVCARAAAAVADVRDHRVRRSQIEGVLALELLRSLAQLLVGRVELIAQTLSAPGYRHAHSRARQPVHHLDLARVGVARANVQANRHAFQLPVSVLVTGPLVAPVDSMPDPGPFEVRRPAVDELLYLGSALGVA